MGSAADAARALLARRMDGWRAWWQQHGRAMNGYEPMTAVQRVEAAEWMRRLSEARRRGELDPGQESGLRSIVQRLWYVQDDAVSELTDAELFAALTLSMFCSGCRRVTAHWCGVAKGGCTECHDLPALRHEVEHWRRHLTAQLAPETRATVEGYLRQAEQRLHDAEQHAAEVAAGTDPGSWSDDA